METKGATSTRILPVIPLSGAAYFVDLVQRQFRETMNPSNYVDFDSVEGMQFCRQAGVVTCLRCGMSVIVGPLEDLEGKKCMRCSRLIGERRSV